MHLFAGDAHVRAGAGTTDGGVGSWRRCRLAETLRVALCDDHAVVRKGLRKILTDEADLDVVGEAATAADAVSLAAAEHPDVFVVDLGLPDESGTTAIRRILEVSPATKVVVLTMHDDVEYLREAFRAGAGGYVVKDAADVELILAIRAVAAGRRHVHPTLGATLLTEEPSGPGPRGRASELSRREADVLRLVALGHTNPEIATRLRISVRTVETHRSKILQKLGLRSRAELARYARKAGLLE